MTATIHTPLTPAQAKAARWQERIDDTAEEAALLRGTDEPDRLAQRLGYACIGNLIGALRKGGHDTLADQLAADRDEWRQRVKACRNGHR